MARVAGSLVHGLILFVMGILQKLPADFRALAWLAVLLPLHAPAGELGRYAPASWSPRDLISAPSGTAGFAPYFSFYWANRARTGAGAIVDVGQGVDVAANVMMFTPVLFYAPRLKPLGADW